MEVKTTTIYYVQTCVIKPEKQDQFMPLWKRFLKYVKDNPELFKVKSSKLYSQKIGDEYGKYIMMYEYDHLADIEKEENKLLKDKGFKKIEEEFLQIVVPNTISVNVWKAE